MILWLEKEITIMAIKGGLAMISYAASARGFSILAIN
jgi:hypothetical protein